MFALDLVSVCLKPGTITHGFLAVALNSHSTGIPTAPWNCRAVALRSMVRGDPMYEWSSRAGSECKRATGTIKTWNVQKQFGFVKYGKEELFLHVARMTKPDVTESV